MISGLRYVPQVPDNLCDSPNTQIAATHKGGRRSRRGARTVAGTAPAAAGVAKPAASARARYAGAVPAANGNRAAAAPTAAAAAPSQADATKILVSNLPADVNESQVKVGYAYMLPTTLGAKASHRPK